MSWVDDDSFSCFPEFPGIPKEGIDGENEGKVTFTKPKIVKKAEEPKQNFKIEDKPVQDSYMEFKKIDEDLTSEIERKKQMLEEAYSKKYEDIQKSIANKRKELEELDRELASLEKGIVPEKKDKIPSAWTMADVISKSVVPNKTHPVVVAPTKVVQSGKKKISQEMKDRLRAKYGIKKDDLIQLNNLDDYYMKNSNTSMGVWEVIELVYNGKLDSKIKSITHGICRKCKSTPVREEYGHFVCRGCFQDVSDKGLLCGGNMMSILKAIEKKMDVPMGFVLSSCYGE